MKRHLYIFIILLLCILVGCNNKYRVNFYSNDRTVNSVIVDEGTKLEEFIPTLAGYEFVNWYDDNDNIFDFNTPIKKNMNLYAFWNKLEWTVNFYDGGKIVDTVKVTTDDNLSKYTIPSKEGYVYNCCYIGDEKYDLSTPVVDNLDLKIEYIPEDEYKPLLKISFNSYGGTTCGTISAYRLNEYPKLPTPEKEGFVFGGWLLNGQLIKDGDKITSLVDFTLDALWVDKEQEFELSFNTNGLIKVDSVNVQYGETINLPTPTKEGFTFKYWTLDQKKLRSDYTHQVFGDVELEAYFVSDTEDLYDSDNLIKYKYSSETAQIAKNYYEMDGEFRGIWVTSYASDFVPSTNKEIMKNTLLTILNRVESLHFNVIIFHLRATNDAYYKTKLAPIKSSYGTYESFEEWDYLPWFIDECHKRGIEFHAWLNPYRIKSSGYPTGTTPADVAEAYANYPKNPASDPKNILMTQDGGAILDPSSVEVQDHVVKVCQEIAQNYDVDAIHFDDYFYAALPSSSSVLKDADQPQYEEYIKNNPSCGYNKASSTDKETWRVENVNALIEKIHLMLVKENKTRARYCQFGISPTSVWKNGDGKVTYDKNGVATSTGSKTSGYSHAIKPLYADTIRWCQEGWIDYLIPQVYHSFDNPSAPHAEVAEWYTRMLKNTNTKLYIGNGFYMALQSNKYGWNTDKWQLSKQVLYANGMEGIDGVCLFSYKVLGNILNNPNCTPYDALKKVTEEYWTRVVEPPKFR